MLLCRYGSVYSSYFQSVGCHNQLLICHHSTVTWNHVGFGCPLWWRHLANAYGVMAGVLIGSLVT